MEAMDAGGFTATIESLAERANVVQLLEAALERMDLLQEDLAAAYVARAVELLR